MNTGSLQWKSICLISVRGESLFDIIFDIHAHASSEYWGVVVQENKCELDGTAGSTEIQTTQF